ncbi:hypothetical protein DFH06DRAFT_1326532 [Mycena polygramma]|nr:hypothetical protein DFH06DRAFT_1326532 [Mycena polygramma]
MAAVALVRAYRVFSSLATGSTLTPALASPLMARSRPRRPPKSRCPRLHCSARVKKMREAFVVIRKPQASPARPQQLSTARRPCAPGARGELEAAAARARGFRSLSLVAACDVRSWPWSHIHWSPLMARYPDFEILSPYTGGHANDPATVEPDLPLPRDSPTSRAGRTRQLQDELPVIYRLPRGRYPCTEFTVLAERARSQTSRASSIRPARRVGIVLGVLSLAVTIPRISRVEYCSLARRQYLAGMRIDRQQENLWLPSRAGSVLPAGDLGQLGSASATGDTMHSDPPLPHGTMLAAAPVPHTLGTFQGARAKIHQAGS